MLPLHCHLQFKKKTTKKKRIEIKRLQQLFRIAPLADACDTPTHHYTTTLIRQAMAKFYYMTYKKNALTCPIIRDT